MDGCFDLMHAGHFNAIRQAKLISPSLICGVVSDESVMLAKGPSILRETERKAIVDAVKWTDEVILQDAYDVGIKELDESNCQHYIHGDDPVYNAEGENTLEIMDKLGRFKYIKRTTGISTTDITGSLLKLIQPEAEESKPALNSRYAEPPKQEFL